MDVQLKRGFIEACVLKELSVSDSYGYQIIKDLSPYMEISESTLYPVLRRLEEKKQLTIYTKEFNHRMRCYYSITKEGREKLKSFRSDWNELIKICKFIMKED